MLVFGFVQLWWRFSWVHVTMIMFPCVFWVFSNLSSLSVPKSYKCLLCNVSLLLFGAGKINFHRVLCSRVCRKQLEIVYLRYSVGSHFVTVWVQVLNLTVVSPLVRNVERGRDWASVGVDATAFKEISVQLFVQVIDGIVECQQDNLWNLFDGHVSFTTTDDESMKWRLWWWFHKQMQNVSW